MQPQKITDNIAPYVNIKGVWRVPKFNYNSWVHLGNSLLETNPKEAYIILALTYCSNGEVENFLRYAEMVYEFEQDDQSLSLFQSALFCNGELSRAIDIFDNYLTTKSLINTPPELISTFMTHSRLNLSPNIIHKWYDSIYNHLDEYVVKIMDRTIKQSEMDLETLKYANIDKALFDEVMSVALKSLSQIGNFDFDFKLKADGPNDDLLIDIHSSYLDLDTMNVLNEKWLDNIVDHESDYSFSELSRVLVSFRPARTTDKVEYAN